jgi:ribonucleoside-diphosphate reductase alpha chain
VWRTICEAAWATGDPGLFFIDRVNRSPANAVPGLQTIEATNPCGEQSLPPYGACTLGHLNLAAFAREGQLDWERLAAATRDAVTFLDNVVEANPYTLSWAGPISSSPWPSRTQATTP